MGLAVGLPMESDVELAIKAADREATAVANDVAPAAEGATLRSRKREEDKEPGFKNEGAKRSDRT